MNLLVGCQAPFVSESPTPPNIRPVVDAFGDQLHALSSCMITFR